MRLVTPKLRSHSWSRPDHGSSPVLSSTTTYGPSLVEVERTPRMPMTDSGQKQLRVVFALCAVLLAGRAHAQLTSDALPRQRTIPRREQMELDLADARLHLGPF